MSAGNTAVAVEALDEVAVVEAVDRQVVEVFQMEEQVVKMCRVDGFGGFEGHLDPQ